MKTAEYTTKQPVKLEGHPPASLRYDWIMAVLGSLSILGGLTDVWAHSHIPKLETFFTPWHALVYGSFALQACFLIGTAVINYRKGYSLLNCMPLGYGLSLIGVGVYALSGVGDLLWHTFFGIEQVLDAAFSPTHLCLTIGGILIKTGPLRSAWLRGRAEELHGWRGLTPLLLSVSYLIINCMPILAGVNPFVLPLALAPARGHQAIFLQALGTAGIFLYVFPVMAPILLVVRRHRLPFGSITLIFLLVQLAVSVPGNTYYLLPAVVGGGLIADLLLKWLRPSPVHIAAFRLFALLVPTLLFLLYFLELSRLGTIHWTIHMWMGSAVIAGVISFLLSYLMFPPRGIVENPRGWGSFSTDNVSH